MHYLLVFALLVAQAVFAADGPRIPCSSAPAPAYAAAGAKPNWGSWKDAAVDAACAPNARGTFEVVVGLSGRFTEPGGAERILERLGALSKMTAIHYWSQSHRDSRPMLEHSTALRSANPKDTRSDFGGAEMKSGAQLHYAQSDPMTGNTVVYRARIDTVSADTIVVEVENATPVKLAFFTIFEPRALRTVHVLRKGVGDVWDYYLLAVAAGSHAGSGRKSIENRALAMYRYVAGERIDRGEPLDAR